MPEEEKILYDAVLVFFVKDEDVLLGIKMKKIGKGSLNSYGGGIEENESPLAAAIRETEEETRGDREHGVLVKPEWLKKRAEILFHNITKKNERFACKVWVYVASRWEGEFVSTEDMADPKWFPIDNLPLAQLMLADPFWLPQTLSGISIIGEAWYGPEQKTLLRNVEIAETSFLSED